MEQEMIFEKFYRGRDQRLIIQGTEMDRRLQKPLLSCMAGRSVSQVNSGEDLCFTSRCRPLHDSKRTSIQFILAPIDLEARFCNHRSDPSRKSSSTRLWKQCGRSAWISRRYLSSILGWSRSVFFLAKPSANLALHRAGSILVLRGTSKLSRCRKIVTVLPEDTFGISRILSDYRIETTFQTLGHRSTKVEISHYYSTTTLKAKLLNLIAKGKIARETQATLNAAKSTIEASCRA